VGECAHSPAARRDTILSDCWGKLIFHKTLTNNPVSLSLSLTNDTSGGLGRKKAILRLIGASSPQTANWVTP